MLTAFLSSYSRARKLGLRRRGQCLGSSHNLVMRSRATARGYNLDAMLRKLGTGSS